jgi:RNA polymerase sigma-70 factor (ECF subfamily)
MLTRECFTSLAAEYIDTVYRVAFNYLKSRADADDVTQNTMLKLYMSDKEFENRSHVKNWLIRVAINECKKMLMSPWRLKTEHLDEYAETLGFQSSEESDLFHAVMQLPKKYRIVVYLYYYEDYSVKEIASVVGRKASTLQTQLMRARAILKANLQEGWSNE